MNERDMDPALLETERRLTVMSRQVVPDPGHKMELRRRLLARHHDLASAQSRRRLFPWSRLSPLKRIGLTLPPAFAALAASIVLLVLPVLSGHQSLQAAEAQRLSPRLMSNVPRISSWQWTVRETVGARTHVARFASTLGPLQLVYVKYGQVYLYDNRHWSTPTPNLIGSTTSEYDWQWAFSLLPQTLASDDFTILSPRKIDGRPAEGIRKTLSISGERAVTVTFWVYRPTGLMLRLERDVTVANREIEHDTVDYTYRQTG